MTGVAGFIGSHLLETLLRLDQQVTGLDNFATGHRGNLEQVRDLVAASQWSRFRFIEGDLEDLAVCRAACSGTELVLHEAALGSVPASMENPLRAHQSNVTGFLNMLVAAREAGTRRFVYASSSAVYGDDPELPKVEQKLGRPLSPYAATKAIDEIYATTFATAYGLESIGLRYFNVFGPRQDPQGAYAAVIPKWIASLLQRQPVSINGDGETTRDFCYVQNVVQANLLAATTSEEQALNQVYNVGLGQRTTLNQLYDIIQEVLCKQDTTLPKSSPVYQDFRPGDIRHSVADISKARDRLGYQPVCGITEGLELAMQWYRNSVF